MTWLELCGVLLLAIILYRVVWFLACFIYTRFSRPYGPKLLVKGQWAVVTGASDGIGKEFARQMAERGMNIVLISRTKSKLSAVASDIEEEFKVETKVIEADFTSDEDIYSNIEKELHGLDIGALVNNVGTSYPYPDYFLDLKEGKRVYRDILKCNIESLVNMCRIVMPSMVEKKQGVVLNISSSTAEIPGPLLSVYSASKIFVVKFSTDLRAEYKKDDIVIQSYLPGYVATNMSKIKKATWMAPTPETYVRSAIKNLGLSSKSTGYFPHTLLLLAVNFLEDLSPSLGEHVVLRTMENIRNRNFKKKTREELNKK